MKTRLIEVEGIDGSGKTTAIKTLCTLMDINNYSYKLMREVGDTGSPLALELRDICLNSDIDMMTKQCLFAAMRSLNHKRIANEYMGQVDYVISDRGLCSHLAYSAPSIKNPVHYKWIGALYGGVTQILPDWIVYVDTYPDTAWERIKARGNAVDKIEGLGKGYQEKVYRAYRQALKAQMETGVGVYNVDGNQPVAGVKNQLIEFVEALGKERGV